LWDQLGPRAMLLAPERRPAQTTATRVATTHRRAQHAVPS
jgi:hypothetical protein